MPNSDNIIILYNWDTLPENILHNIFKLIQKSQPTSQPSLLSHQINLSNISLVNKRWRSILIYILNQLAPRGTFKLLPTISTRFPNLTSLDLSKCKYIPHDISSCQQGISNIEHLTSLKNLKRLIIRHVNDKDLMSIAKLTQMNELSIDGYHSISDDGIRHLKTLENLNTLDIIGRGQIKTCEGFKCLMYFPKLEILKLKRTLFNDTCLNYIINSVNLVHLDLSGCRHVNGCNFNFLSHLKNLRILSLSNTSVDDKSIENLVYLSNLRSLDLSFCTEVSIFGLAKIISHCLSLENLKLLRCEKLALQDVLGLAKEQKFKGSIIFQKSGDATKNFVYNLTFNKSC